MSSKLNKILEFYINKKDRYIVELASNSNKLVLRKIANLCSRIENKRDNISYIYFYIFTLEKANYYFNKFIKLVHSKDKIDLPIDAMMQYINLVLNILSDCIDNKNEFEDLSTILITLKDSSKKNNNLVNFLLEGDSIYSKSVRLEISYVFSDLLYCLKELIYFYKDSIREEQII